MRFLNDLFSTVAVMLLLVSSALFSSARADQVPLWEAGAGFAYINFPVYRGSDERESYLLPMPYVIYRGDSLKVDPARVRGMLYHTDKTELNVSMNGSVPVRNNAARRGMSDLDPTLEIGPSLIISLYRSESDQAQVELRLPLRCVISSDFSYLRDVGWLFQPLLNLDVHNVFDQKGWKLGMGIGPLFTDSRYNQYFYGVDAGYARAGRPAYTAHGGYAGAQFVAAMTRRFAGFWTSGFMKLDTLHGAVFEDSPLVRSKQNATVGFAITWIFAQSSTKVEEDK